MVQSFERSVYTKSAFTAVVTDLDYVEEDENDKNENDKVTRYLLSVKLLTSK